MSQNSLGEKKLIAVCGGIGAGKSTVARILRCLGHTVIDCDKLARDVAEQPEVIEKIGKLFGASVISGGKINRRALKSIAFSSAENIKKLDDVFFGRIMQLILKEAKKADSRVVFAEVTAPSALEKSPKIFTEVWEVCASESTRIRRVVFRDNIQENLVKEIMSRQEVPAELVVRTINNDGNIDELKAQIVKIVRNI